MPDEIKLLSSEERFKFYDYYKPSLTDGNYTLTITPSINIDPPPALEKCIQHFKIEGPRFVLETQDIHAFFPPKDSSGNFSTCLPHITFNKKALPWERSLNLKNQEITAPWLALICLEESEYSQCKVLPLKVQDWLGKTSDDFRCPDLKLDELSYEEKNLNCQVLQIPSTIFFDIVPTIEELPYLAHVRQVSSKNTTLLKAKIYEGNQTIVSSGSNYSAKCSRRLSLAEQLDTEHEDYFSALVCNRFPNGTSELSKEIKHYVFLVSLEGLEEIINENKAAQANVCIATLANWSFTCLPAPKETFSGLMRNIFVNQASSVKFLNLPALSEEDKENKEKAKALNLLFNKGYVPLTHRLSTAETTWAWYRGPLVSDKTVLPQDQDFSQSSKAAYIYLSEQEVFDVAYAAAWELGRLLAMADPNFIHTLMQLRYQYRQNIKKSVRLQEIFAIRDQNKEFNEKLNSKSDLLQLFAKQIKAKLDLKALRKTHVDLLKQQSNVENITSSSSLSYNQDPLQTRYKLKSQLIKHHRENQLAATSNYCALHAEDSANISSSLLEWLNARRLLKSIPFQYLVVNPELLPINSIRFFYVDPNWIKQMEEGCFSLGLHCTEDSTINEQIKKEIRAKLNFLPIPVAGFLLHSSIVSGWPDLIVELYAKKGENINMLRQESLGNNVLLCLFDNYPESIEIKEPEKHMCFGGEGENLEEAIFACRYIDTTDSHKTGESFPPKDKLLVQSFLDLKNLRTLNIATSKENSILNAYQNQKEFNKFLTSSEFALQLIKKPLKVKFKFQ